LPAATICLGKHLGSFHHLALIGAGQTGLAGESVHSVGFDVEQIEQAADRPVRLI
jgi:hypothetical protein